MSVRVLPLAICAVLIACAQPSSADDGAGASLPLLQVLRETGATRDGVPVLDWHPDAARYVSALTRGMSGRLLRLYALEQRYLDAQKGIRPEPAYLLISTHMGGFPRFGFYLGSQDKRSAGYVDLPAARRIGGRFGAMDQIFPHELGHVILVQLAGPPQRGGSNQMHAVGVRTDAFNAFSEGFAEHFQVLAVDDADALGETKQLRADGFFERRASMQLREYAREVETLWPVPGRRLIAFPLWFSGNEQVLRYYAVKANAFARQPRVPPRLLGPNPYGAYLLENVLPGVPSDPPRSAAQLASTEGAIAALFVAWLTDADIQRARPPEAFYAPFGTTAASVAPLENAYLKLFHAFFVTRPQTVTAAIAGYRKCFPDEAAALDRVVSRISCGRSFDAPPPVWLANADFRVGTSVFDQYRSLPRVHTFDLNAASIVDLVAVRGVDAGLAEAIRRSGPYQAVGDLRRVPGMSAALLDRFRTLERRATERRTSAGDEESSLSFWALMKPFVWRLLALFAVAGFLGGVAYRLAVPRAWWRATINGIAAALPAVFYEIALDFPPGVLALLGPVLFFGVPAGLYCLLFPRRTARCYERANAARPVPGRARLALATIFAWMLAGLPLVLLITPHF